jgi:hypothetical protein
MATVDTTINNTDNHTPLSSRLEFWDGKASAKYVDDDSTLYLWSSETPTPLDDTLSSLLRFFTKHFGVNQTWCDTFRNECVSSASNTKLQMLRINVRIDTKDSNDNKSKSVTADISLAKVIVAQHAPNSHASPRYE